MVERTDREEPAGTEGRQAREAALRPDPPRVEAPQAPSPAPGAPRDSVTPPAGEDVPVLRDPAASFPASPGEPPGMQAEIDPRLKEIYEGAYLSARRGAAALVGAGFVLFGLFLTVMLRVTPRSAAERILGPGATTRDDALLLLVLAGGLIGFVVLLWIAAGLPELADRKAAEAGRRAVERERRKWRWLRTGPEGAAPSP